MTLQETSLKEWNIQHTIGGNITSKWMWERDREREREKASEAIHYKYFYQNSLQNIDKNIQLYFSLSITEQYAELVESLNLKEGKSTYIYDITFVGIYITIFIFYIHL